MRALYVYAIVPEAPEARFGGGLDGNEVRGVTAAGVTALVHAVESAAPYAGEDAQVKLWVQQHFDVVDRAWRALGAALPMTFDVLVAASAEADARARIAAWLEANAERLRERLEHVKGRCELRVEVRLRLDAVGGEEVDALDSSLAKASRGIRVLLEKKREQLQRSLGAAQADALHAELRAALCEHAIDVATLKVRSTPAREVSVLAIALLVDEARVEDVGRVLGDFQARERGLEIAFHGPFPPFHFVELPPVAGQGSDAMSA